MGILLAWMYFSWKKKSTFSNRLLNRITEVWVNNPYIKYTGYVVGISITYGNIALNYVFNHYKIN